MNEKKSCRFLSSFMAQFRNRCGCFTPAINRADLSLPGGKTSRNVATWDVIRAFEGSEGEAQTEAQTMPRQNCQKGSRDQTIQSTQLDIAAGVH